MYPHQKYKKLAISLQFCAHELFLFGFSFQVIYCECDPFPLSAGSFIRLISSTTVKSALKASSIKAFPLEQTCSGCLPHSLTSSGAVSDSK